MVLTNQNGSAVPSIVRDLIADRMLKIAYHDWNSDQRAKYNKAVADEKKADKEKVNDQKHNAATHPLTDFAGKYHNPGYGTLELFTKGDSLFAKTDRQTLWLRHNNYDIDVYKRQGQG